MNKIIKIKVATCAVNTFRKQAILNCKFNLNNLSKKKRKGKEDYDTKIDKLKESVRDLKVNNPAVAQLILSNSGLAMEHIIAIQDSKVVKLISLHLMKL